MVDERTAYWGERDAARYRTRDDDPTGGDYVVAETLDANGDPVDVLLRWDDTANEWVSGGPVNMNGKDLTKVGALDADSVSTGSLVIGGTLYEEDGNSPINASSTDSVTYSVSGTYDQLIILAGSGEGFNQLRVNGDSGQNYDYLDNADNQTQSASEWGIPRVFERDYLSIHDIRGSQIEISTPLASRKPGQTVAGDNTNVSGPITQFTLSDSGGANRDLTARVFGREI